MILRDLAPRELVDRLRGGGVLLRCGPFVTRLGTSLRDLSDAIGLLYADYEIVPEGGIVDFDVRVDPAGGLRRWVYPRARLVLDGRPQFQMFKRRIAPAMMEWAVNWCGFTRPHHLLLLHSVSVARGPLGLLLPGPPGAGKSTLCAAMVFRGWRLLSDELAAIRPGTIDLIPVPRPIGLKERSIEVIRRFAPEAVVGPACRGTHKGAVAHVRPPRESIRRGGVTARARWVVFPAWGEGRSARLEPISKSQTLVHVADDAFNFSVLGAAAFETLAAVIDACDCYELRYGRIEDAIEILDDLAAKADAPDQTRLEKLPTPVHIGAGMPPVRESTRLDEPAMPPSGEALLAALRAPRTVASLGLGEWDRLLRRARNAEMLSRLAWLVGSCGVEPHLPAKVRDHLAAARVLADHHERSVRWEANRIRRALASTRVPVVLLKGAAYVLADLPPAKGRLLSDVDILVPKPRLDDVEHALGRDGWEPMKLHAYDQRYYRTWMHELPPLRHRERGTVIDVHHTILPETGRLHPDPRKLLAAARPIEGTGLLMLAPADMVLHSAAHLFQDGDLAGGLRDLTDLDALLRHFCRTEAGFWGGLVPRAVELDLARPLYYALHFAEMLLGTPVPPAAAKAAEVGRPGWPMGRLTASLATRALLGDDARRSTGLARYLLYVRSHWLRMPPLLLAQHLARKALRRWTAEEKE